MHLSCELGSGHSSKVLAVGIIPVADQLILKPRDEHWYQCGSRDLVLVNLSAISGGVFPQSDIHNSEQVR